MNKPQGSAAPPEPWVRRGSRADEWWSLGLWSARKEAGQWVLRHGDRIVMRDEFLQNVQVAARSASPLPLAESRAAEPTDKCVMCRGTGRVGIPGAHCTFCDGTGTDRFAKLASRAAESEPTALEVAASYALLALDEENAAYPDELHHVVLAIRLLQEAGVRSDLARKRPNGPARAKLSQESRAGSAVSELRAALEKLSEPTPFEDKGGWQGRQVAFRMDAYYYGFGATGIKAIDMILSAVACAGKSRHHTEGWNEDTEPYEHLRGRSNAEWIQNAAEDAADLIRATLEASKGSEAPAPRATSSGWTAPPLQDGGVGPAIDPAP